MGSRRDFSWMCLTAGGGGTGVSAIASVEDISGYSGDRTVVERCLINVGDSTQRLCGENKIKLARVSCIVICSLAPHNISGLAGVILSLSGLGVGELTVAGPVGINGLMHTISSFVNRKYPVIRVLEVGAGGSKEEIAIDNPSFTISLMPMFAKSKPGYSLGVAAVVRPKAPAQGSVACIPVPAQFAISPAIYDIHKWIESLGCATVTYVPMTVSRVPDSTMNTIKEWCEANEIFGVMIPENLDFGEPKETSEIEQTVQSIALTSFLAPAVFPRVSSALSVMNILQENKGLRDKNLVSGNEKASLRFKSTFLIEKQAPDIDSPYGGYFVSLSVPAPPRGLISAVPKLTLRYNAASNLKGDICVSRAVEMKIFVNDSISGGFDPASQSSVQDIVNYCTKLHQQHRIIAKTGWLLKKLESITALNARNEVTIASIESHATSPEGFLSNFICQVISESKEESSLSSDISRPLFLCAVHKGHLQAGVDVAELFSNGLKRTLRQPESECATCGVLKLKLPQRYCFSSQFVPPPDPRDPIVSFLGTGCATPSKYRSNSAILVQCTEGLLDPKSNNFIQHSWAMLLDAGESVCCQLHQLCSSDLQKYNDILLSIRIIWISHHHADHQTGLISLLQEIYRVHAAPALTSESSYQNRWTGDLYSFMNPSIISKKNESCRVVVIAPENVLRYAEYISCASGLDDVVQFVDINRTKYAGIDSTWAWAAGPLIPKCGKGFISSVPVEHCRNAFGICFTLWRPGTFELLSTVQTAIHNSYEVKIVFSGDCRPSISLVEVGQGCDLLIHEATFDDSMKEDALCKRHCTSSEALQVADAMQARHVVLTHFSQRYPRIMTSTGSEQYTNAVDFLRFAVPSQAVTLPALMNAVAEILGSETDE